MFRRQARTRTSLYPSLCTTCVSNILHLKSLFIDVVLSFIVVVLSSIDVVLTSIVAVLTLLKASQPFCAYQTTFLKAPNDVSPYILHLTSSINHQPSIHCFSDSNTLILWQRFNVSLFRCTRGLSPRVHIF